MPIKATEKKTTTTKRTTAHSSRVVAKPIEKNVDEKKETVTKSHIVTAKKSCDNNCSCWDSCTCGDNCSCGCTCKCCAKLLISILVLLNLIVAIALFVKTCKHSAWNIEALKDWWKANMENVIKLYTSDYYVKNQSDSISSYLEQLSAN